MNENLLTRAECAALRGIAIIGIFLHNYCHWLPGIVRENEYQFHEGNVRGLQQAFGTPDWNLPMHILSFFGHYGVPVFLFLSAYGLVMKYEKGEETKYLRVESYRGNFLKRLRLQLFNPSILHSFHSSILPFLKSHFKKLWLMMFVGFVAFIMIDAITPGRHHYHVPDILAQLLLINNVFPHPDRIIWPGPYWFFGLMMQFYIVYRLLLYRRHWGFTVALMVICQLIQLGCDPEGEALNRWRYNFIGGMLPFGAGLLYARYGTLMTKKLYAIMFPVSLLCIYLCSGDFFNWTIVPLMVVFAGICFVKVLNTDSSTSLNKVCSPLFRFLIWMGGISAALFVCHPITRKIFIPISRHGDMYTGLLLYTIASIGLAWLFREMIKRVNR